MNQQIQEFESVSDRRARRKQERLEYQKEWHKANPDKVKAAKRKYYEKNKEIQAAKAKERKLKFPKKYRARQRAYYARHKEDILKKTKAYKESHPEVMRKSVIKYQASHKEEIYARIKKRQLKFRGQLNDIKVARGCVDCGYNDSPYALDFDHVRGVKVKNICQFHSLAKALVEIEKCEVRCANCHRIKTRTQCEYRGWRKRAMEFMGLELNGQKA